MSKKKNNKKLKNKNDFPKLKHIKDIDSEKWSDDSFVTKVSISKTSNDHEGIKIRTAKTQPYFREHRPGVWIPKSINLKEWFNWLYKTLRRFVSQIWGKEISDIAEELEHYKKQKEELEKELEELRNEQITKEQHIQELEEKLNRKENELELAKEVINKLEDYEKALEELKNKIEDSYKNDKRNETDIKKKIRENRWVLGIDCEVKAKEKEVDPQLAIDLHIKTDLGENKIFEFKSPNLKPFFKKKEDGRLHITNDLADGLNQLIMYMRMSDAYSEFSTAGVYKIQAPVGYIIIGYKLDKEQTKWLDEWNRHLRPHIRIITFDKLLRTAELQLENIRYARKIESKNK